MQFKNVIYRLKSLFYMTTSNCITDMQYKEIHNSDITVETIKVNTYVL